MVPRKLLLNNFLSYRQPVELGFDGIHLACISGLNGAGKSTILDAITWALFGRSRSRSDDDLVNRLAALNGEAAEVRFEFELEDTSYRVIRRKTVGKATVLELQIAGANGNWKPLSESRIRETQAAIEQLLRMNYDTFTNASFLLQGKADEFTTKTPNRRKEVLAELLGVTQWDLYRETTATQRKAAEGQLVFHETKLADIEQELEEEEERAAALEIVEAERQNIVQQLKLQESLLGHMRQTAAAIEQQKQLVGNLSQTVRRMEHALGRSQETQRKRLEERASHEAVLEQAAEITAAFAAWQTAEANVLAWQKRANEYNRLLQAKRPHELAVMQARSRLEQEQQELLLRAQRVAQADKQREQLQQTAEKSEARLGEVVVELNALAEKEEALQKARAELSRASGERELWQRELKQLQTRAQQSQNQSQERERVCQNLEQAQEKLETLNAQIVALAEQNNHYVISKAAADNLQNRQLTLRERMDKLKDRIGRLKEAGEESQCPLCGQALSPEHRAEVLEELTAEGRGLGDEYRANKTRIDEHTTEVERLEPLLKRAPQLKEEQRVNQQRLAAAEARLQEIEKAQQTWEAEGKPRLQELETALAHDDTVKALQEQVNALMKSVASKAERQKEQASLQQRLSEARAQLREIERQAKEWVEAGAPKLKQVEEQLAQQQYAAEAQTALAALQAEIEKVAYDHAAHEAAAVEQQKLSEAPTRHQGLQQAQAAVKPLEATLAELEEAIAEQEAGLAEQRTALEQAQSQLEMLSANSGDMKAVEDEVFRLREAEVAAAQRVGAAKQKLAVLQELRQQKKQIQQDKKQVARRVQRLKMLEKACGREGVQALLIEHALPEIEESANQLLDRLSGGDMRVSFNTQRQLKSRDALAETLDIEIADRDGVRPYDNYSGGEQFRVNFAIRLALSQLLAKRAGARLQTLVIDEGFGSQDPRGRQRLVEAINTIQDQFACILVITHVDDLRDAFPTRIQVTKEVTGSAIEVI